MKKVIAIICLSLASTSYSFAATAQQEKMKSCNIEAKSTGKKGPDRRAFMKQCLSGGAGGEAKPNKRGAQQEKMKSCNAEAKSGGKKGADRKAFMKECLSK
jgi:psiF repeat